MALLGSAFWPPIFGHQARSRSPHTPEGWEILIFPAVAFEVISGFGSTKFWVRSKATQSMLLSWFYTGSAFDADFASPHSAAAPPIRLPSYKELTAASRCDDRDPAFAPPHHKTAAPAPAAGAGNAGSRSRLFTAGLIHLPPLKLPTSPSPSASTPSNAHTSSLSSVHKLLAQPHTNVNKNKRRYYEDDVSEDEPRYLDLSRHHPLPSHAPRVPSPASASASSSSSHAPFAHPSTSHPSSSHPSSHAPGTQRHLHTHISAQTLYELHQSQSQPRLKFSLAKAAGQTKKQALSCYFCRDRKIACGRPDDGQGEGGACNQCTRRKLTCTYPTVSHRGQHSRIKSAVRKGLAAGARVSASADSIGGREGQENVASGSESVSPTAMSASPPQMMSHDAQGMHMEGVEWERERSRERAGMEEAEVRMTMALSVSPPFGGIMNERERAMGCERGGS